MNIFKVARNFLIKLAQDKSLEEIELDKHIKEISNPKLPPTKSIQPHVEGRSFLDSIRHTERMTKDSIILNYFHNVKDQCSKCRGKGKVVPSLDKNGKKIELPINRTIPEKFQKTIPCDLCEGDGSTITIDKGEIKVCEDESSALITTRELLTGGKTKQVKFINACVLVLLDKNDVIVKMDCFKSKKDAEDAGEKAIAIGKPGKPIKCPKCNGIGSVMNHGFPANCPVCLSEKTGKGTGKIPGLRISGAYTDYYITDVLSRGQMRTGDKIPPTDEIRRKQRPVTRKMQHGL